MSIFRALWRLIAGPPGSDTLERPRWMLVELMGHRQVAGLVSETPSGLFRIEVPAGGDVTMTKYVSPRAVFAMHEIAEDQARGIALADDHAGIAELLPNATQVAIGLVTASTDTEDIPF